jgi:exopolyphosphatase/guanosine-5'-triphosphate,3'-diphosphate pyrophosphatase
VAEAALELFEFKKVKICPWALREGLILRRLDQLIFEGPLEPAPHVALPPVAAGPDTALAATAPEPATAAAPATAPTTAAPAAAAGGRAD